MHDSKDDRHVFTFVFRDYVYSQWDLLSQPEFEVAKKS